MVTGSTVLCSFLILSMPVRGLYFQPSHAYPFSDLTCHSWSSFYFVWQCNAHVWCSITNQLRIQSYFIISQCCLYCAWLSSYCPRIGLTPCTYLYGQPVLTFRHVSLATTKTCQNIAWLYKHMHSVRPICRHYSVMFYFFQFCNLFECPVCFVCLSRSVWSSL
jgi:hypothetical protein